MAFCPNCGTPNTDQAEKCVACGFELIVPKQKAKFKGTIMMSGIKAPTAGETQGAKDDAIAEQPTEPPPASSLPSPAAATQSAAEPGRNPNYAKTMMGHAPIMASPPRKPEAEPTPAPAATPRPSDPVVETSAPSIPSFEPPPSPVPSSVQAKQLTIAEDSPAPASVHSSWAGTGAARPQARAGVGGYDSTVPPSAPPAAPKPGKIIALGCGVALALFCVVGSILYYVVGSKMRSMMASDDSGAEAAAWQASIVQSLAQVSELCKVDCTQAGVYFHPLKEAGLLGEARLLTPERLQKLSDSSKTAATMLNGTDDEGVATKLGLDPQQCARVSAGSAKVISCSVPDPSGKPSVLRIVDLSGVGTL